MEEGQNYPPNKTRERKMQRRVQIPANKSAKYWSEGTQETVNKQNNALYNTTKGRIIQRYQIDQEENPKYWQHPADTVKVNDNTDETTDGREDSKRRIQVHTDGSKTERGVGAAVAIFKDDKITDTKKYRLDGRGLNNQAEQLAIFKALENIQNMDTNDKTVQIYTDSRIALESLKNRKSYTPY